MHKALNNLKNTGLILWRSFRRLTTISFPRQYPIVQFPNLPLIAAFIAEKISQSLHGNAHNYLLSAAFVAMTVWAYEELVDGVNWFRHLLGLTYMIIMVFRIAGSM
jgi:hypothetical protein